MGKQTNKAVVAAQSSGIVVGSGSRRFHVGPRTRGVLLGVSAVVLVAVIGGSVWSWYVHVQHVHAKQRAEQQRLKDGLTDRNKLGNINQLKTNSSDLIQGAANGTYKVSDKDLAQAHVNKGDAELNTHDYKGALTDYQKAAQLYPADQDLVNYGEFVARYHLGERATLIPLLQAMEKPLKNNQEPQIQSQVALYEQYISNLRAGKDLPI